MNIIAHRGFSHKHVENTLSAFQHALDVGATIIECDIQEIHGEFYVFHDWSLKRLFNLEGDLQQLSRQQIENIRFPSGDTIPSMTKLFKLVGAKATINLELKHVVSVHAFVDVIIEIKRHFDTKIVISSFNHHLIDAIRARLRDMLGHCDIKYAALIAHLPLTLAQYASDMSVDIAAIDAYLVNEAFVNDAHNKGLKVWCYTVNDEVLLHKLMNYKVDAIFTDDPLWGLEQVDVATRSAIPYP